ncbi:MAG: Tyrosine-protein phosphatase YopH [Chlamydiae bacterium]|nr:Tyrosine-protein phosphatase YopH [Chlamydiota bacterium]
MSVDHVHNWCFQQWKPLLTCSGDVLGGITRVVVSPLLAIATLTTEILIAFRWTFHYCFYSRKERLKREYEILRAQDEPINLEHFTVAIDHPDRNRYHGIFPNEPTRVKLEKDEYFNANWVLEGKAIACQAPLPTEFKQFWNMVFQKKVKAIITLTNPVENGIVKCTDYWSSCKKTSQVFSKFENEMIKHRELQVRGKKIDHFHLENWPDFGVVNPKTLAKLVKKVSKIKGDGPILVHCSAGIGRTGTFLAAYEAFRTKSWNIFRIAKALRNPYSGRVGMIHNDKQYTLIHDTVRELLT